MEQIEETKEVLDPTFKSITDDICRLLMQKNAAYGSSVKDTFEDYGLASYIIRLQDKVNRLKTLDKNPNISEDDEKIEDTLKDLAGYAILAMVQLRDAKRSELELYAENELNILLERAKAEGEDSYKLQKVFNDNIMEVVKSFCNGGHSGMTANMAISALERILKYRPLTRLNLTDDEWVEVADGVYQNRRAGNVFKQKDRFDGKPYCIDGPNGELVSLEEYPLAYWGNFDKPKKQKEDKSTMTEGVE